MIWILQVGTYVPFAQLKPNSGFSSAVALKQMTVGAARLCGMTSMFSKEKFEHEVSVLHSTMMASVCVRLGSPTSYQHGYKRGQFRQP